MTNEPSKNSGEPLNGPGFAAFIDLHDSTYAWDQDAGTAALIVRDLYALVEKSADEHHGLIANFTGDGFLLLFTGIEPAVFCLSRIIAGWEPNRTRYIDSYFSGGVSAPDRFFLRLRTGISFGNFGPLQIKGTTHYSGSGINKAQRCEAASKNYFFRDTLGKLKAPNYVFLDSSAENLIQVRSRFDISEELPAQFKGYFQSGTSPEKSEPETRKQFLFAVWPRDGAFSEGKPNQELKKIALAQAKSDIGDRLIVAAHAVRSAGILHDLSASSSGQNRKKMMEEALAAYRTALEIYAPGSAPADYVKTQLRLGSALRDYAFLFSGEEKVSRLEEAAISLREAIKHSSPETFPADFAVSQNNLGNILRGQAGVLTGPEKQRKLAEAVTAFREALRVYGPATHPADHAMTQNNLGNALTDQTGNFSGAEKFQKFEEGIAAYRKALSFYSPSSDPVRYAGTQNNLGTAIKNQALLLEGPERLKKLAEAEAAYTEALRIYTPESSPDGYAMVHNNIGRILGEKAEMQDGEERNSSFTAAISSFHEALRVFTADSFRENYAITNNNLGDTLARSALGLRGEERSRRIEEARAAYGEAVRILTPSEYPDRYEKLQKKISELGTRE